MRDLHICSRGHVDGAGSGKVYEVYKMLIEVTYVLMNNYSATSTKRPLYLVSSRVKYNCYEEKSVLHNYENTTKYVCMISNVYFKFTDYKNPENVFPNPKP